jgi:hypothetical protein
MRQIPKSRIKENQYTNGTGVGNNLTLRFVVSKVPYVGFYNVISGSKYFTGKMYTSDSKPLEKYNLVQTAPSAIASLGSIPTITPLFPLENTSGISTRYFYKELNRNPIIIKEIDKSSYNKLATGDNMNYQVISYNPSTQSIDEVAKQMPGLKEFLLS